MNLRMLKADFDLLYGHLFQNDLEQHAYLFCRMVTTGSRRTLVVREVWLDEGAHILAQTPVWIELNPLRALEAAEKAHREGLILLDAHSHPFAEEAVDFSGTDRAGALERDEWHTRSFPGMGTGGLVFGRQSLKGSLLANSGERMVIEGVEVIGLIPALWGNSIGGDSSPSPEVHDRQVRAFGSEAQRRLGCLTVAVLGLGGLGSIAAPLLALAGVGRLVLVDMDRVEETNLNRLLTAGPQDVGRLKVEAARDTLQRLAPHTEVVLASASLETAWARNLLGLADLAVLCLDNDGARLLALEACWRMMIPCLDLATGIKVSNGMILEAGGQASWWIPGHTCPWCTGSINALEAGKDLAPQPVRQTARLVYGDPDPAPAVGSLNGTVASLGVTEALFWAAGRLTSPGMIVYDALEGKTRRMELPRPQGCPLCLRLAEGSGPPEVLRPAPRRTEHVS